MKKIGYVDFVSLYPSVQYYEKYPVGHYTLIPESQLKTYNTNWFGFVHCKILPPRGLYLPVLSYRSKEKKLIFGLCRTCIENNKQQSCHHTDEERSITGFWGTPEVNKAIEKGYQVKEIYEVRHFNQLFY